MYGRSAQNTFGLYPCIHFDEYLRGKKMRFCDALGFFFLFFFHLGFLEFEEFL